MTSYVWNNSEKKIHINRETDVPINHMYDNSTFKKIKGNNNSNYLLSEKHIHGTEKSTKTKFFLFRQLLSKVLLIYDVIAIKFNFWSLLFQELLN